jgi:selenocysteine-specific elongation factor
MSELRPTAPTGGVPFGVIGHVDHGKTALVRALTGMETDRLPDEQRRGISIALGFAHLVLDGREIDLIDMPGHERFVRTMISGATGVGAVMVVVAANEGVKPQTVEHIDIAALLGVRRALPVITKADLVSPDAARAQADDLEQRLGAYGFDAEPALITSATTGAGLEPLRQALARMVRATPPAPDDGFPYLPIDRVFSVTGHGTVATGTLRRGPLRIEDALVMAPGETPVRIRGLQVHGRSVETARPGERVAVNLRGIPSDAVGRGLALAPPDLLSPSSWLSVDLRSVDHAPALKTNARLRLLFGATEVEARLRLLDRDTLEPGARAVAQLNVAVPVSAPARERFILRLPSPALTVAGGIVLDPAARRLRRRDPTQDADLKAWVGAMPEEIIAHAIAASGAAGVSVARLARVAGLSPERVETALTMTGGLRTGARAMTRDAFNDLVLAVLRLMVEQAETQPNGIARRRIGLLTPGVGAEPLDAAIAALVAAGRVRQEGGVLRLAPRAGDEQARARQDEAIAARLGEAFRVAAFNPPDMAVAASTPAAKRGLDRLLREGVIVRTYDRVQKREVLFHRDAVIEARRRLAPLLVEPGLLVKDAGAALGISRKYSVPLLEYLDTIQFTQRVGDRRILGRYGHD